MEASEIKRKTWVSLFLIALWVLVSCIGLFWLDKDTKKFADLLKPGNLIALALYVVPTFIICLLAYGYLFRNKENINRITLSLLTGLPVGFTLVMLILGLLMGRI